MLGAASYLITFSSSFLFFSPALYSSHLLPYLPSALADLCFTWQEL